MDSTDDRITALEIKLAYLEDFMNKIQSVTLEHGAAIEKLRGETRAILDKMGDLEDAVQDMPHVRPPHY